MSFISNLTPSFGIFTKRIISRVGETATIEFGGKAGNILIKDVFKKSIADLSKLTAGSTELGRLGAYKLRAKAYYEGLIKPILTAPLKLIRRIAGIIRHPGHTLSKIMEKLRGQKPPSEAAESVVKMLPAPKEIATA